MPYSADHKAETRKRIVESARKLFNRRGFSEVSIDEIMGAAGLTRGGFYNHFTNKDELYAEAITRTLACEKTRADGSTIDFDKPPHELAPEIIRVYLSERQLVSVDDMCPLVALPSDTARGGEGVRRAYTEVLSAMIGLFEASQGGRADARSRAIMMATQCVGGMVLARAVDNPALSREIREASMEQALLAGGWSEEEPVAGMAAAE